MGISEKQMLSVSVNPYDALWAHTEKRILDAKKKSNGDYEKFKNSMVVRLNKMTHHDKIVYAIRVLEKYGYDDIVDIYFSRVVIETFKNSY